jgi:hypothetical protein
MFATCLQDVIRRQSLQLGLGLEPHGTDAGVLSSIVRITGGTFRLVERLFAQIERVAAINDVTQLTTELFVAAQEASSSAHSSWCRLILKMHNT